MANNPLPPAPLYYRNNRTFYKDQGTWERVNSYTLMKQADFLEERKENWTKGRKDDVFLRATKILLNKMELSG